MGRGKSAKSLELIEVAKEILAEIQPATVRAVCYRLFVDGLIDSMEKSKTNGVGVQLVFAREEGIIPWGNIVDETREIEKRPTFTNTEDFMEAALYSYRRDHWDYQDVRVEVWSEKGTRRGILKPVLDKFGVGFRVMHGFGSATAVHEIAEESGREDKPLVVLYVGDWDPSGLRMDMVDLPGRLLRYGGESIKLRRIALTTEDIGSHLPSFDVRTKTRDTRYTWYCETISPMDLPCGEKVGMRAWELDALNPNTLRARVHDAIEEEIDLYAWDRCTIAEEAEQRSLKQVLGDWNSICRLATE